MKRLIENSSADLLRMTNRDNEYIIQEIKLSDDIDLYNSSSIHFLNSLNEDPNIAKDLKLQNDVNITSEILPFLKETFKTINKLSLAIFNIDKLFENIKAENEDDNDSDNNSDNEVRNFHDHGSFEDIINTDDDTDEEDEDEEEEEDDDDNDSEISNNKKKSKREEDENYEDDEDEDSDSDFKIKVKQNKKVVDSNQEKEKENKNEDSLIEPPVKRNSSGKDLLNLIKSQYEELILNRSEDTFQLIFMNPFKLNFNRLNEINIDFLECSFLCSMDCDGYGFSYTSNIDSLKEFIVNNPHVKVEVFWLELFVKEEITHVEFCEYCNNINQIRTIDLNKYFTKISRIQLMPTAFNQDQYQLLYSIRLKHNNTQDLLRLYHEGSCHIIQQQPKAKQQIGWGAAKAGYVFNHLYREIPNLLSFDRVSVIDGAQEYSIFQDQILLMLLVFKQQQLQNLLPYFYQKSFIDLLYK